MKNKKYLLGIAGYIGSGKTTAGKYFKKLGALFIDADEVVNDLYKFGMPGHKRIESFLGSEFIDKKGNINRVKLAKYVFNDKNKLKILNNLIHPLVENEVRKMVDKSKEKIVVIEASYFKEKSLGGYVDSILWINCNKKVIFNRVLRRSGMSKKLLKDVLSIQKKPFKIDFIVDNNKDRKSFYEKIKKFWEKLNDCAKK